MRTDLKAGRWLAVALGALLLAGCADMKDQPRYEALEHSDFFADGSSARHPVEGTIARGTLRHDDAMYKGMDDEGNFVTTIPVAVDEARLERGRERYDIFCSPCHDQTGSGYGMIVRRGYKQPTSFHDARLKGMPHGYYYDVITNGFGDMSSYAAQVKPEDRWAIVAYIRALQLAHDTELASLPADLQQRIRAEGTVDTRQEGQEDHGSADHH